jgi:hypothetical protein
MSLLNKSHVRKFTLDYAAKERPMPDGSPRFTAVGGDLYEKAEAHLRQFLRNQVKAQPSKGKTIK